MPLVTAANLVEATQDCGAFVQLSGVLKRVAVKLSKTCNDLRLLSSGPRAGLDEINLPPVQAGSSIMPGKVNPVIPEVVNQVAFEVIGNDVTVTMAAEAGQLQLNAFEPIIVYSLMRSAAHLAAAVDTLATRCVSRHHRQPRAPASRACGARSGIVTALIPYIGYPTSAADREAGAGHWGARRRHRRCGGPADPRAGRQDPLAAPADRLLDRTLVLQQSVALACGGPPPDTPTMAPWRGGYRSPTRRRTTDSSGTHAKASVAG